MKGLLKKTEARHAFTVMKHNHMPGGMLGTDDMFIILKYSTDRFYKLIKTSDILSSNINIYAEIYIKFFITLIELYLILSR